VLEGYWRLVNQEEPNCKNCGILAGIFALDFKVDRHGKLVRPEKNAWLTALVRRTRKVYPQLSARIQDVLRAVERRKQESARKSRAKKAAKAEKAAQDAGHVKV